MGIKHDAGKPDYTLITKDFLDGLSRVMMFGAEKYGRDNWRTPPLLSKERLCAAIARHLWAIIDGEDVDAEDGIEHRYHIAANVMMMEASNND
ncbi:hypothetical protein FACS1894216_00940 [Synergistales bacterium]|nr:hypothetical protein FACS1894216_00940 [Synergistales bacterium]